ncbi:hypothetical protein ABZP36_001052 [Zizania latifolia]
MEHAFSVEEIAGPLWFPPPPPQQQQLQQQPQAVDGVAGVGVDGVYGSAMMDRCPSGWSLEKFLEEELLDGVPAPQVANPNGPMIYPSVMAAEAGGSRGNDGEAVEVFPALAPAPPPPRAVLDPVEYNAMLKRKLDEDLAAVAMWRASGAIRSESSLGNETSPNTFGPSLSLQKCIGGTLLCLFTSFQYLGIMTYEEWLMLNEKLIVCKMWFSHYIYLVVAFPCFGIYPGNGILVQNRSSPYVLQNIDAQGKQATSSSSREPAPSDDDDMEGEAEAMGNMILDEDKVKKRKESNRESARRSRCRKAARLKDLEEQVAKLRADNSSLLRRLADSNQKYSAASINNRVLIAEIEALRAKASMCVEGTVDFWRYGKCHMHLMKSRETCGWHKG